MRRRPVRPCPSPSRYRRSTRDDGARPIIGGLVAKLSGPLFSPSRLRLDMAIVPDSGRGCILRQDEAGNSHSAISTAFLLGWLVGSCQVIYKLSPVVTGRLSEPRHPILLGDLPLDPATPHQHEATPFSTEYTLVTPSGQRAVFIVMTLAPRRVHCVRGRLRNEHSALGSHGQGTRG